MMYTDFRNNLGSGSLTPLSTQNLLTTLSSTDILWIRNQFFQTISVDYVDYEKNLSLTMIKEL